MGSVWYRRARGWQSIAMGMGIDCKVSSNGFAANTINGVGEMFRVVVGGVDIGGKYSEGVN